MLFFKYNNKDYSLKDKYKQVEGEKSEGILNICMNNSTNRGKALVLHVKGLEICLGS